MPEPNFLDLQIDTRSIDAFIARFPVTAPRVVEQELRAGMNDALEIVLNEVVDRAPVASGIFRESLYSEIVGVKAGIGGVDVEGVVSSSDYEPKVWAIEYGRPPGKMPPIEAIALWVRRKGIAGVFSVKTKKRKGGQAQRQKEDLSAAWAIAINIARHGTKAQKVFEQAGKASERKVIGVFDDVEQRILLRWAIESGGTGP